MSGFEELHLEPAVGAVLKACGYEAADARVRDQAPTAARGHNLLLALPPAARHALPALAGLVSAMTRDHRAGLVLAPAANLDEWSAALLPLCRSAGVPFLASDLPARAARLQREGRLGLLLTTPGCALALQQRSALKLDLIGHLVLAWPELFENEEALTALMQDLPAETQRILVPLAPKAGHPLAERYARRAHTAGPLLVAMPPVAPVRAATVAWSTRSMALRSLLESEDPRRLAVWCADESSAAEARAELPCLDDSVTITCGEPPPVDLVVAWDLPDPARLARLRESGEVVLLVPPHAMAYAASLATRLATVRLRGALDSARDEAAKRLAAVEAELSRGGLDTEVMALAPLFERHDPALVAAALHRLWRQAPAMNAPAIPAETVAPSSDGGGVSRIWLGTGKKDGTGPNDIVAALTRDAGVSAGKIGRIEIRELFSLVEVPAAEAEEIARRISGRTIRRRTVTARLDRPGGGERPGGRRGSPRTQRPAG